VSFLAHRPALLSSFQRTITSKISQPQSGLVFGFWVILSTRRAEGRQVRSFQVALNRLRAQPGVEKYLIHKAGPLFDVAGDISDLAGVYARGLK